MIKVFDCSNTKYRPPHRMSGGPFQNDVMRQLAFYGEQADQWFVNNLINADVVVTNDVFTPEALSSGKPLVKRMDGIFFQEALADRNMLLNEAAEQADVVVFISGFSKQALHQLYPEVKLKRSYVALNAADPLVFHPKKIATSFSKDKITWACSATRWDRPEKRYDEIIKLSKFRPQDTIIVLGDQSLHMYHSNVFSAGYREHPSDIASLLQTCDAFFHPAYRDAAPKTVAQALSVGLPVLGVNSGGLPELVTSHGVLINEPTSQVCSDPPALRDEDFGNGLSAFIDSYLDLKNDIHAFPSEDRFSHMLDVYYHAIKIAHAGQK